MDNTSMQKKDSIFRHGTGNVESEPETKIMIVPYDIYDIVIEIDQSGRFMGIEEVRINKSFLSLKQLLANQGDMDVEEFYEDDE